VGLRDKGVEVEYRLTRRDCDEIGERVEELTQSEEMAKLEREKLKEKQRTAAAEDIAKTSERARDAWQEECEKKVGEIQERKRVDCALGAKAMADLEACLAP
jgi:hypothetical protein